MRRIAPSHLALALAVVFSASWLAYGALGGGDGVRLTYQGRLELNGATVDSPVNLGFEVYNQASGGAVCWSGIVTGVTPRDGAFSTSFGPVTESCVKDRDVWLALLVDGVALDGRQKITPVLASMTSGRGDQFVAGQLQSASASVIGAVSAGSVTAGGGTFSGAVTMNGAGTTLDVNGTAEVDVLHVTDELNVDGDLDVAGTVTWSCPAGSARVGSWCISDSRGSAASPNVALLNCHNLGMSLCPLEAVMTCDVLNAPSGGNQCGTVTDRNAGVAGGNTIMTSSVRATDDFVSSFSNALCFAEQWNVGGFNVGPNFHIPCTTAQHFYCCAPVSAH